MQWRWEPHPAVLSSGCFHCTILTVFSWLPHTCCQVRQPFILFISLLLCKWMSKINVKYRIRMCPWFVKAKQDLQFVFGLHCVSLAHVLIQLLNLYCYYWKVDNLICAHTYWPCSCMYCVHIGRKVVCANLQFSEWRASVESPMCSSLPQCKIWCTSSLCTRLRLE